MSTRRLAVRCARPLELSRDEIEWIAGELADLGEPPQVIDGLIGWLQTGSRRAATTEARWNSLLDQIGFERHRIRRRRLATFERGAYSSFPWSLGCAA